MDSEFIQKLKNGDEPAFRTLVEKHKDNVVNTCFGFVNNYHDADDLAQDVFVEVFRSIDSFKEDSKLSTWIYRIAVNKSLDFIRKTKRKKRWSELFRFDTGNDESIDNWVPHNQTPDIELEQKERIEILKLAIDNLPPNQKAAFTLQKYEDLSYQEIAEVLNTSLSSVESLMHRAKQNLKKSLKSYYENKL
ncbi:MAG: RNA polymerase sigma factor [Salinivirgaceae bacterium]